MKWFRPSGEAGLAEAQVLRSAYDAGELLVMIPSLFYLELLDSAARRWHWSSAELADLVAVLIGLGFQASEPSLYNIVRWQMAGLTAYDACYLALAEEHGTFLVTADEQLLRVGGGWVRSLAQAASEVGG